MHYVRTVNVKNNESGKINQQLSHQIAAVNGLLTLITELIRRAQIIWKHFKLSCTGSHIVSVYNIWPSFLTLTSIALNLDIKQIC